MEIIGADNKFELLDETSVVGSIGYDGFFSFKANIEIGNSNYKIFSKGIFSTVTLVTKEDIEVANMKMNFKGHIVISLPNGQEFIVKPMGIFQDKYVLEDQYKQKLMLLTPHFNWKCFRYSYTISYETKPNDILLVLLAVYAANYCIAQMSAAIY
ncbi:MAG: hypothetical protein EOP48_05620 [Sphingobacteriales bacterium]|nr:MAG: hypothetical protein EOP48_05620 [Sphingobacteriales bacterium]